MVIAGHDVTEQQVRERIAYLQMRMLLADQFCDDKSKARLKEEIDWLSWEIVRATVAA